MTLLAPVAPEGPGLALSGAPVLSTEHLRLRAPEPGDFEAFAAFLGSWRARHLGGPVGRGPAWRAFCHMMGHWVVRGWGPFVIEHERRVIGHGGPWRPDPSPATELGWCLWREGDEGRGHAAEAVRAARAHAWALGIRGMVSYVGPFNARSVRVAERVGAVRCEHAERPSPTDLVFRHPDPEGAP